MMINSLTINHKIDKKAEGTYYTIPFSVPDGVERITVNYSYNKEAGRTTRSPYDKNIVDLGLIDQSGRFLGWSGSARRSVHVGPHSSTNGYLQTEIKPGNWEIIAGAYKIPEAGLDVHYEISFKPHEPQWLTGDTHMHSDASDGQYDIAALAKKAKKAGLDFIAVSNHNNYTDNLGLPVVSGLTLLPAVEWTHYKGHLNFFGAPAPFENSFITNNEAEMLSLVKDAKIKGALVSVNHPKCSLCPYLWDNDDCFDMVEVWNGPMRRDNMNAISWWHELLMRGRKIPATGGSDFHRTLHPVRMAHPVTRVFSQSQAAGDILKAISNGHSYITSSVRGAVLDLHCENAMMGDTVTFREGLELSVEAVGVRPGCKLELITSDGTAGVWKRFPQGKLCTKVNVQSKWRFAYLLLTRNVFGREYVRAITNPVYFE